MVAVHRVVPDPRHPLAALVALVDKPEDFEELLSLRALTDPLAADALQNISLVAPADRYTGPRAAIVMAPFLTVGASRFSPGTYGVLYTAETLAVAIRESSYHAAQYLRAAHVTSATRVPRYALELQLDEFDHVDIRRSGARDVCEPAIYDPDRYAAAQSFGMKVRAGGHRGIWYDSVRSPAGACYATLKPIAVVDVAYDAVELELAWDGLSITEYRTIKTCRLKD